MRATLSSKGQLVIPEALRDQARLKQGDQVDIGYWDCLIVMRKRRSLTPDRIRALLVGGRELPEITEADSAQVVTGIREARLARRPSRA
jgi:AbrB family looped-hinge helix DNA binding protein